MKKPITLLPELYLICATVYYWTLTASFLNPIAIVLLTVLIYLTVKQHADLGLIITSVILVVNSYLILALLSEVNEVHQAAENANQLIIMGSLFIGLNLIAGTFLLLKNLKGMVRTPTIKS